jgi:hypothetical protein
VYINSFYYRNLPWQIDTDYYSLAEPVLWHKSITGGFLDPNIVQWYKHNLIKNKFNFLKQKSTNFFRNSNIVEHLSSNH